MNIAVGSAFRNAAHNVGRYLSRVVALKNELPPTDSVRVIAVAGDCSDNTIGALSMEAGVLGIDLDLVQCNHGGPDFGSTEDPARMAALSKVGNAIFDQVRSVDDVLVYVESDLLWYPTTIVGLVLDAWNKKNGFDVFAPLVFAGPHFYDIWGFRRNGERFGPFIPSHPDLNGNLLEIDSAGSCLVMRSEVARKCRIRDGNALVGWCADARAKGFKIAVDPTRSIVHG